MIFIIENRNKKHELQFKFVITIITLNGLIPLLFLIFYFCQRIFFLCSSQIEYQTFSFFSAQTHKITP